MCWFDKAHPAALYQDIRKEPRGHIEIRPYHEINPDEVVDFRSMPHPDRSFKLVLFDPPHTAYRMGAKRKSIFAKKYGTLDRETWRDDLAAGFKECWRVLDFEGVLIFKWSSCEIPLSEVLKCFDKEPLFGHTSGKSGKTHWMCFVKLDNLPPPTKSEG